MEWSERNKYSSFNSYKGLTYYENYKNIVAWMNGDAELRPPVECNLDPYAECNLRCGFCITQRYLRDKREEVGEMRVLPEDYMIRLVDFLADWGVRGFCISGGGEPTLHDATPALLRHAVRKGMEASLFTNAVKLSDEMIDAMMVCKWISLSVDAGDRETYKQVKGADRFSQVVHNLERLSAARNGTNVSLVFKLLILPENADSIFKACKLAKEVGLQAIHIRPADLERLDITRASESTFDIPRVYEAFERCHELEDDNFRVFTVTHKFDPEFRVKHDFEGCLATPLVLPIMTDGNAYLCVDHKMEAEYKLGSCYPDPLKTLDWWGSDKHRELIKSVNIERCSRCTWGQYNSQIENTVLNDSMSLSFP